MVKAYLLGCLSATLAVVLVAVIWFAVAREQKQPGLLWGDRVYTSRQEFDGYLKAKGLSYRVWLARNPGAAPWEPGQVTLGPITVRASTKAREDWLVRLPLAALALLWAVTACAVLGLRRLHTVTPSRAARSVAFFSAVLVVFLLVATLVGVPPGREPGPARGGAQALQLEREATNKQSKGSLTSKGRNDATPIDRKPSVRPVPPTATKSHDDRPVGLLATLGLMVATMCALLLSRRLRPAISSFVRGPVASFSPPTFNTGKISSAALLRSRLRPATSGFARGPVASFSPTTLSSGKVSSARPPALASIRRLAVAAARVARPLRAIAPLYVRRLIGIAQADVRLLAKLMRGRNITLNVGKISPARPPALASIGRLGVVAAEAVRPLGANARRYVQRLIGAARADARLLSRLMRDRNITVRKVAFSFVAVMTAVGFALFFVLLVSP